MKHQITQFLNRNIVPDAAEAKLVQCLFFVVSIFVLSVSFWKLGRLDLTEAQMLLGVLLSLNTAMLLIVLGMLPMAIAPKKS